MTRTRRFRLLKIQLTPGTPFDHTAFDAAVVEEASLIKNLVGVNKAPCIVFRVTSPTEDQAQLLEYVLYAHLGRVFQFRSDSSSGPDTLIWNTIFIEYLFWYRRYAGQVMVHDKIQQEGGSKAFLSPLKATLSMRSVSALVPDTFLAAFPKAATDPDVMDVVNVRKFAQKTCTYLQCGV